MSDGQLAMNTNLASPGLFFKDSNGDLVKVGPVHVGTTAPNATPGAGGQAGNSKGEQWLDTSSSRYVFKIWDGTAWRTEDGEFVNISGDTMTGALGIIAGTAAAPSVFFSGDTNTGIYSPGADQVAISTNGTGRVTVDSSGRLLVGTSTARGTFPSPTESSHPTGLQIESNTINLASQAIVYNANNTSGGGLILAKSRGTTNGSNTVVQDNDTVGFIAFEGADGSAMRQAATISAAIDGAVSGGGAADMPGRLVFSTTADGASTPTERMRINNAGNVGIGTTNPLSTLHVVGLIRANTTATATTVTTGLISTTNASANTGNVAIETTCASTATRHHISFVNPNGVVGSISTNASATAYNTSSDYRLKENVVPLSGAIDRLQQIPVHRFNFIADPDTVVDGFIAHEAQEIVPECVTGTKDEIDEDGNPVYQGIDQSKMVPLAVAAIQECIKRIEVLETELALLKNSN
jgi:hypothetical protein